MYCLVYASASSTVDEEEIIQSFIDAPTDLESMSYVVNEEPASYLFEEFDCENCDIGDQLDTVCGCEETGSQFCKFDGGETGSCESCSSFSTTLSCFDNGLPDAGANDCVARCFPNNGPLVYEIVLLSPILNETESQLLL